VAEGCSLSTPMMRHATGFHDHRGGLAPAQKPGELSWRETVPLGDPAEASSRTPPFQVVCAPGDSGTMMPYKSREESIPSLGADGGDAGAPLANEPPRLNPIVRFR